LKLFQFGGGKSKVEAAPSQAPLAGEPVLLIGYASQTGAAEQLARQCADAFERAGQSVAVEPLERLDAARLARTHKALFVVATTGEGDPPDHVWPFERRVMGKAASLGGLSYAVLSLGDRQYCKFCSFGRTLDAWLLRQGAKPLFSPVEVDDLDPHDLAVWSAQLSGLTGQAEDLVPEQGRYQPWRLVDRQLLNAGSAGGPVYHVELEPLTQTSWEAGDIAQILPQQVWEPYSAAAVGGEVHGRRHREYSIASTPTQGRLHLLIRQTRADDGVLGFGSGWLTHDAALDSTVVGRIRANAAFYAPADDRPMILIGNGSGLAGLRAHLLQRIDQGRGRNWLIFGERNAACDYFYRDQIEGWRRDGQIERLDLAFSRDLADRAYVQDRLTQAAADVRAWVAAGASIYVCGSLLTMAPAVTGALKSILSESGFEALAEAGRYRRDVY
jgi:sulfite reductase (NADPH) flavoprotein alpha-component